VSLRTVARYASGRLLDGTGTGGYLRPGSGSWWRRRPGWQRQAVRLGVPVGWLAGETLYATHPWLLLAGAAAAGPFGVRRVRTWWRARRFHREYTNPTLAALRPVLGEAPVRLRVDPSLGTLLPRLIRPASPAEQWVRERYARRLEPAVRWLPDRLASGRDVATAPLRPAATRVRHVLTRPGAERGPRIHLEAVVPYLTPDQRLAVESVIGAKLPAGELVGSWDQVGQRVSATWTVRRRPPTAVGYADLAARFDQLADDEFFLGLAAGGKSKTISFSGESPHIALSAGSGAGKSVLAKLVALQVLARGGEVVILDIKGSHRWALGMPGVTYCTKPEQMHKVLLRLDALADERNDAAPHKPEGWVPGKRYLVIAEELNATMARIKLWWDQVREKHEPKTPPAISAFRNLMFMGRSAFIHVLAVAQMLSALATGGPEARENFGIRCLARYTKNNWQMLCDGVAMPRPSRTLGRWQIVVGGEATETQVCYLTDAEAKLFVAKYRGVPEPGASPLMASDQELFPEQGSVGNTDTDPLSEPITLRQAVDRGIAPWSFDATKRRLQRAGRRDGAPVPQPVGRDGLAHLYRAGDLIIWIESELVS
jgi:hypothetical protein